MIGLEREAEWQAVWPVRERAATRERVFCVAWTLVSVKLRGLVF